jgi:hypothetical protein
MAETIKLEYDDGYKNIQLGDDPNRVIRINPTDQSFLNRIADFDNKVEEIQCKYGDIDLNALHDLVNTDTDDGKTDYEKFRNAAVTLDRIDMAIRELINSIFEYDVSSIVFGDNKCTSLVGGKAMFMNFIEVVFEYIAQSYKEEAEKSEKIKQEYELKRKMIVGLSK